MRRLGVETRNEPQVGYCVAGCGAIGKIAGSEMIRAKVVLVWLAFGCAAGESPLAVHAAPQNCPATIESLALNYNHQGGQSKPELSASFSNRAGKRISSATFELSLLDQAGYPHVYPHRLTFSDGLETGKVKTSQWALDPASVDIHRTGEVLQLRTVEFEDATSWKDDGSESCELAVDYHAR